MFSPDGFMQELFALGIVAGATAYLLARLIGWPIRRAPSGPIVRTSDRLARGLAKAEKRK